MRLKRSRFLGSLVAFLLLFMLITPCFASGATVEACLIGAAKCLLATLLSFNLYVYFGGTLSCVEGLVFCLEYLVY